LLLSSWRPHLTPSPTPTPQLWKQKPSIGETSTSDDLPDSLNLREDDSARGALLRILISRFVTPHWWQSDLLPNQLETRSEHQRIAFVFNAYKRAKSSETPQERS
jgi:hypothetical protein